MAAHVRLKNEFMEDKKYHNLMTWLKCIVFKIVYFCCRTEDDSQTEWGSSMVILQQYSLVFEPSPILVSMVITIFLSFRIDRSGQTV